MDDADREIESSPPMGRFWIGVVLGPLLSLIVFLVLSRHAVESETATALSFEGRVVASVAVLMAVLWITEAIPIPATSLIPVALFPPLTGGRISIRTAAAPYAHELIFLFLGGFLLALSMQRWGLHRRIALHVIRLVGRRPRRLVAGFMLATAFLSMWMSNTATTVMMLPIAVSVFECFPSEDDDAARCFAVCLFLGIAYAASIGGIGTLIGTPPNAFLAAFLEDEYGLTVSFARWMAIGLPLVAILLPAAWLLLTRALFRFPEERIAADGRIIEEQLRKLGRISGGEKAVLTVFVLTAVLWMTRRWLLGITIGGHHPLAGLTDSGIAVGAAIVLFLVPVRRNGWAFLLTWKETTRLPWGVLILFGGGLSLARGMKETGVTSCLAHAVGGSAALPTPVLVLLVTTLIVFLTELTSNTATTAAFLPVLAAVGEGLHLPPLILTVPAAVGASLAFMMPVATPPNAIVFSTGRVTIPQMCKAGFWLNLIGIAVVMTLVYGWILPLGLAE